MGKEAASLVSSLEISAISDSLSSKSKTLKFSTMRALCTDLERPCNCRRSQGRPFAGAGRGHVLSPLGMWSIYQAGNPLIR